MNTVCGLPPTGDRRSQGYEWEKRKEEQRKPEFGMERSYVFPMSSVNTGRELGLSHLDGRGEAMQHDAGQKVIEGGCGKDQMESESPAIPFRAQGEPTREPELGGLPHKSLIARRNLRIT